MKTLEQLRAEARKAKRGDAESLVLLAWGAGVESVRSRPRLELEGCGDNSCIVAKPKGMATNGGCRCDERRLRLAVMALHGEIARMNAERATNAAAGAL